VQVKAGAGLALALVLAQCAPQKPPDPARPPMTKVETILHATEQQLASGQAKITYLGPQTKPIPTVVLHAQDRDVSMEDFTEVQPTPEPYPNDPLPTTVVFAVTPAELHRMLLAVEPVVTATDAGGDAFLAFTVVRRERSRVTGAEWAVGPDAAPAFYRALIGALDPANAGGRAALTRQATHVGAS